MSHPGGKPWRRSIRSRTSIAFSISLLALFAAGLVASIEVTVREWAVRCADARLRAIDADPNDKPMIAALDLSPPPRAAISEALAEARAATSDTVFDIRARRLDRARALLAIAEAGRPGWPLVRVVESYVESVALGARAPKTLRAFAESFKGGAFLREAAPWRISYGLSQWALLDPATRQHVVDETAWYSTLRGSYTDTMMALVGQPAEVPVMRERADLLRGVQTTNRSD